MTPLRVLVADDHAPTRKDVRDALEADPAIVVCAEVADAAAAVDAALRERPDICLLDVRMPGGGIAAAREIAARLPKTRIVMLTIHAGDVELFGALRAGASGYLLKDMDPARLPHALRDVAAGKAALPRELGARLLDEFRDRSSRRRRAQLDDGEQDLTGREWQVLDLLRRGLTTAQIAERLVLSPATVRTHIASVLRKLELPDRAAAVRLFEPSAPVSNR